MPSQQTASRRKFLKIGVAAAVVVVAAGVGGSLAFQAAQPPPPAPSPTPAAPPPPPSPPATPTPTPTPIAVMGATADERAINAIKELQRQGKISFGTKLRYMMISATRNNYAPKEETETTRNVLKMFEQETGIPVEFDEVSPAVLYEKAVSESVTKSGTWDVMATTMDFAADHVASGLALPLDDFVSKYDPELTTGQCPAWPVNIRSFTVGDNFYGFPVCGDWQNFFFRRDLAQDPREQEAFEKQFGYPLPVNGPETWEQAKDLLQFFDRPDQGIRGAFLPLDKIFVLQSFWIRFWQLGGVFFDENKNVRVNSPEGRQAAEDIKAIVPFMDPVVLNSSWEPMYTDYATGKAFAAISWGSLSKFSKLQKIGDRGVGVSKMPGYTVQGRLIRTTIIFDQWGNIVNRWGQAKNPELSYLFLQWLSSPTISTQSLTNVGAISDPWRTCHLDALREIYASGSMEAFRANLEDAVPLLQLTGWREIQDIIGSNVNAFLSDVIDIDTAFRTIEEEVNAAVDRIGRDKQFAQWETVKRTFPKPLKELHGWA